MMITTLALTFSDEKFFDSLAFTNRPQPTSSCGLMFTDAT